MNYKERYKLLNEELSKCEDKTSSLAILLVDSIKELEEKYPEVKESEDERIRKKVIDVLKRNVRGAESQMQASRGVDRTFEIYACYKVISWLEKQAEQKPVNDLTPQEAMDIAVAKCFEQGEQKPADDIERKYNPCYNMSFEEAQEYISNRGFDIPWTDCDVFVDFKYVTQTVGNVLKWADNNPKWKPSDEQIKALDEVYKTHGANNVCRRVLFNLMNDLKKLMEG